MVYLTREYNEDVNTTYDLKRFPQVWILSDTQDIYNESFYDFTIPYPIGICIPFIGNSSYKFVCDDAETPKLLIYVDGECTRLDTKVTKHESWKYECGELQESCAYVSLTETYYANDACSGTSDIRSDDNKLDTTFEYAGTYAVDACVEYGNGTSYKYECDTRTKTFTIVTFENSGCSFIDGNYNQQQAGLNEDPDLSGFECTNYNDTDIDNNVPKTIEIKSQFNACTSIDKFDEIYNEYCVSSQVIIIDTISNQEIKSIVPQFGPFGLQAFTSKLSFINSTNNGANCNLCNITTSTCDNIAGMDNTILVISQTQLIENITKCDGQSKQFVKNLENLNNISINGVFFISETINALTDENNNNNNNNISIPTRMIHPDDWNNMNNKQVSLTCNYETGYPKQICISVQCDLNNNNSSQCDNIQYAGTYIIQNMSDISTVYNNNPTWLKTEIGDINEEYIWLNNVLITDGETLGDYFLPYIKLEWIISSAIGEKDSTSLYCNIIDVNTQHATSGVIGNNFDVRNCEWKPFNIVFNNSMNVFSAPYTCFDNQNSVPIAFTCLKTYAETNINNYNGSYYEIASGSNIYIGDDAVLKKGNKYSNCYENDENNMFYTLPIANDNYEIPETCKNESISWILYDKQLRIHAYCGDILSSSLTTCHEWYIYNELNDEYENDYSFDIDNGDYDKCNENSEKDYDDYSAQICLNLTTTNINLYSHAQYLWGTYQILSQKQEFNRKPIYRNINLKNTKFDTYIIWYDPLDSWIFITKEDFILNHENYKIIFSNWNNNFDKFLTNNNNNDIIVAYCNDNKFNNIWKNNYNDELPQECETGWIINNIFYNGTYIKLFQNECINNNDGIIFSKEDSIADLCLAFYSRENDCLLPGETTNALNSKKADCESPTYFDIECSIDNINECSIDSNGIYTQQLINNLKSNRSYWRKIEDISDSNNDTIYSYIYYHQYLRLWIWTSTFEEYQNNNNNETFTFEEETELGEINITAWCLKWDENVPDECNEFYYYNNGILYNASTIVDDCTIIVDDSINYGESISAWLIVSCLGVACCVFIIGFYKEFMEKRNQKKGIRVSILQNDQQFEMTTQIDINTQPNTIIEEKSGDVKAEENDKLNPVISASSTDILQSKSD